MAEISKPDYRYVWSSGGANVSPSNTKIQTGWVSEVPPYQWENYLQNRQDNMLVHINQHGMPQWDAFTEYFANKSYTLGSDGLVYKAVQNSGPGTTTQDPTTDATDSYWIIAFASPGAFLTQSQGDARYLQVTNNGSDINNTATFRTNIGVYSKTESEALVGSLRGAFKGLMLSASGASAPIAITVKQIVLMNNSSKYKVGSDLSLTASLSVSGVNGLDTGTSTTSTWYNIYIISNGTLFGSLISLSPTAPTLPSGYTYYARVGSFKTDGSANKYPLGFKQVGSKVKLTVATSSNVPQLPIMASGVAGSVTVPTWVAIPVTNYIPPTATSIYVVASAQTGASQVGAAPNSSYGGRAGSSPPPIFLTYQTGGSQDTISSEFLLEDSNIWWASSGSANQVQCAGWEESI